MHKSFCIRNLIFDPRNENIVILHNDSTILIINKEKVSKFFPFCRHNAYLHRYTIVPSWKNSSRTFMSINMSDFYLDNKNK